MGRDKGLRHARKHVAAYLEEAARFGSREATVMMQDMLKSDNSDAVISGLKTAFSHASDEKISLIEDVA